MSAVPGRFSRAGLAPTGNRVRLCFSPLIRPSVSSPAAFDLDLPAPSGGRVEVLRSGQPGMDAGLAAHGAGPERGNAEPKRGAGRRGKTFWFLLWRLTKGTRRKGETLGGRYRRNGYVRGQQEIGRLSGRYRQQAGSYRGFRIHPRDVDWLSGRHRRQAGSYSGCGGSRESGLAVGAPSRAGSLPQSAEPGRLPGRQDP
jgi:hypothetical protein